jgi:hypothetical protein
VLSVPVPGMQLPNGESLPVHSPPRQPKDPKIAPPREPPLPYETSLSIEELTEHHMEHWRNVAAHMQRERQPWDDSRLQAVLPKVQPHS